MWKISSIFLVTKKTTLHERRTMKVEKPFRFYWNGNEKRKTFQGNRNQNIWILGHFDRHSQMRRIDFYIVRKVSPFSTPWAREQASKCELVQRSARGKRVMRSKRVSERCELMSEWPSEWPGTQCIASHHFHPKCIAAFFISIFIALLEHCTKNVITNLSF